VTEHKYLVFNFADVEVREREFSVIKAGEVLPVEPKAFRVLLFLLRNPHKLITKDQLLDAVWNDISVSENSLTRSIALLRRVLGDDTHEPRYIATVPTVGYRFLCDVQVTDDGFVRLDTGDPLPPPAIHTSIPAKPVEL
jgi:DNA-binding winged helix-turn-helix (wHTH) protein